METTRPLTSAEKGVLALVVARIVETRQATTSAALSVVCMAEVREWFPRFTSKRVHEMLGSIGETQWHVDADTLRQPMPIFWNVLDKGQTFVIEIDSRFLAQRESERHVLEHQLPELIGLAEAYALDAVQKRGLSVRIDRRDGKSQSPFQTGDIRRNRANLKIEHGAVVGAWLG